MRLHVRRILLQAALLACLYYALRSSRPAEEVSQPTRRPWIAVPDAVRRAVYRDFPAGAWRWNAKWSADMDALVAKECSGRRRAGFRAFCELFADFDSGVALARHLRGPADAPRTVNIVWATSDYAYWPPAAGLCEDDERGPPLPADTEQTWRRYRPPPDGKGFDPGPWHRCPVRCCHYPHRKEGGPMELADADGIRFSWSAANADANNLVAPFGSEEAFEALPERVALVLFAVESPAYYRPLGNAKFLAQFDVVSTFNVTSDVPSASWNPYELSERLGRAMGASKAAILADFRARDPDVLFLQSNCRSKSGREAAARALNDTGRLASYGRCLHNRNLTLEGGDRHDNRNEPYYRRHRFALTFENSVSPGYITEKPYNALAVGTIPIYRGPPEAGAVRKQYFPPNSVLFYDDFASAKELVARLDRISKSDAEAWKLLRWRAAKSFGGGPRILWEIGKYSVECRMCMKVLEFQVGKGHVKLEGGAMA